MKHLHFHTHSKKHAFLNFIRNFTLCLAFTLFYFSLFSQTFFTCAPNNSNCTGWISQDFDVPFSNISPNIPADCVIGLRVYYRKCGNTVQIGDWTFLSSAPNNPPSYFNSDECEKAFFQHLESFYGPTISDTRGFAAFWKNFSINVVEQVGAFILQNNLNSLPQIPPNSSCWTGTVANVEYYQGSCQSICIGKVKNKKYGFVVRKGSCGSLCCKMNILYCIDISSTPGNIKLNKLGTTFSGDPGECRNPTTPGDIDFECETGTDGEPNIQWLYNLTCEPICSDRDQSKPNISSSTANSLLVEKKVGSQYLNVSIYPNPATDLVNLTFKNQFKGWIKLINLDGKELYSNSVTETKELQVNTSNLDSGIYLIQFIDESKNLVSEKINIIK